MYNSKLDIIFCSSGLKSHKRDHDEAAHNAEDPVKAYTTYVHMALVHLRRTMVCHLSIHFFVHL